MGAKAGVFISVIGDKLDVANIKTAQKELANLEAQAKTSGANTASSLAKVEAAGVSAGTKGAAGASRFAQVTGGAFSLLDTQLGQFGIPFTNELGHIGERLTEVDTKGTSSFQHLSNAGQAAFLGIAAAAVAVGYESVHLADDFEVSHARLENATKKAGLNFEEESGHISAVDTKLEGLGFTNTDTEASLSTLVRTTKDMDKATQDEALAADIARGRRVSLEQATSILVKVETGRVGALGKLGIATKTTTGDTISQEEALRRLSQMYGGDAAKYTQTFTGETQVLRAELTDLAKDLGLVLIPMLEDVVGTGVDVFEFFDHNRTAAIALGVVIGGPLAVALAAFAATKAVDTAQALGTSMVRAANWIPGVVAGTEARTAAEAAAAEAAAMDTIAIEANNVVLEQQISLFAADGIAADAAAGQLELFTAAETESAVAGGALEAGALAGEGGLAALLGTGAVAAGVVVGLTAVVLGGAYALGYFDDTQTQSTRNGIQWAQAMVKGIVTTHDVVDSYRLLKQQHDLVGGSLTDLTNRYHALDGQYVTNGKDSRNLAGDMQSQLLPNMQRLVAEHDVLGRALAKLHPEYEKEIADQKKAVVQGKVFAAVVGVEIPASLGLGTKAQAAMQKAVAATAAETSIAETQQAVYAGVTTAQFTSMNKAAGDFAKAMASSFQSATDPFAHFGSQLAVSEADMEQFFVGSRLAASTWSSTIERLIHEGVDVGIVQEMAKAGPQSQPSLDAFSAMVDQHGVEWVNSMARAGQDQLAAVDDAFSKTNLETAIKGAEFVAIVGAFTEDAKTGGHQHLFELMQSSDANLSQMATNAGVQMGIIANSVNGLPTRHNIEIAANWSNFWADAPAWVQQFKPRFDTGGLVPGAPGTPVDAIVHGGEYVLSADVVDRIKKGGPSRGAQVAASFDAPGPGDASAIAGRQVVEEHVHYEANVVGSPVLVDEDRLGVLFERMKMLHG